MLRVELTLACPSRILWLTCGVFQLVGLLTLYAILGSSMYRRVMGQVCGSAKLMIGTTVRYGLTLASESSNIDM